MEDAEKTSRGYMQSSTIGYSWEGPRRQALLTADSKGRNGKIGDDEQQLG
jgi:hypothetical protein